MAKRRFLRRNETEEPTNDVAEDAEAPDPDDLKARIEALEKWTREADEKFRVLFGS